MGSIDPAALRRKVEDLQALPTIPSVLKEILGVIENSKTSLKEISGFVSNDPSLTLKILKMVNSPIYGFPGRISSVSQAVVLLGLSVVKGLLLGISVFDLMQKSIIGLWEHSLGCSVAARILAKMKGIKDFEDVSVAGLLHDLGKVILMLQYHQEYENLMEETEKKSILIYEAEREFFGVTHANVAVWMTEKWNFPKSLVDMIGNHHRPGVSRYTAMETAIVHVADILVRARGLGFAGDHSIPPVNQAAWRLLDLSEDNLRQVFAEMEDDMEASANLFE